MTIEQRVAVLEEIFAKLQDYYTSAYSGEEIDARLASAGVPIGITKEYKSVAEMNQDFTGTDVQRGQFVLILPDSTSSADYGKVYLKGTANWVYAFTLTTLTSIKGPIGPPGKNGVKGDPGEAGSNFAILGYFDTLDALKEAVPNPKAGDVYGVGTAPPYNIYIWDSVHGKWVANGNLQGPEGPVGGSGNFVRYDEAQPLTDEQKAQARTNINAAPGGFGLGGASKLLSAADDLNNIRVTGWYSWSYNSHPQNAPDNNWGKYGCTMHVFASAPGGYAIQTVYDLSDDITHGCAIQRTICVASSGNTYYPWEWVNPPMILGTEYRTTERYLGKPVYVKTVDCGLPQTNTTWATAHGISGVKNFISATAQSGVYIANGIFKGSDGLGGDSITIATDTTNIHISTYGYWATSEHAIALLKYTKTTD